MTESKFLQIHMLTTYHASLLNRDDAGFAKRIPFGSATRTRISSQCLKRHWRTFQGAQSLQDLEAPKSIRSRLTFQKLIADPLLAQGLPKNLVEDTISALMGLVLGKSPKKVKEEEQSEAATSLKSSQITILGEAELDYMRTLVQEFIQAQRHNEDLQEAFDAPHEDLSKNQEKAHKKAFEAAFSKNKELKANLTGIKAAAGLDAALFGRMVTSDMLARGDAAVHVAHAFTVHAESSEADYFSAVDDLLVDSAELGSGHINTSELTTGLYYTYVVVDLPLLVSNLEGCSREEWARADHTLAKSVIERFVHLMAKVSPGAKLGSTAPFAYAQCMMIEAGDAQPRSFADAFAKPVSLKGDMLENTYTQWAKSIHEFKKMYGWPNTTRMAARGPIEALADVAQAQTCNLEELASWAAQACDGGLK